MSIDTAVVLAAGEGNRLHPLTRNRPKPMLPAANRPILEYVLDALIDAGISRLCLVVGYKRDRVQDHFGPSYRNVDIEYVAQEKQLGSGHALQQAASAVEGSFVVVNGDRVIEPRMVEAVIDAHTEDGSAALAVLEHGDARRYGAVEIEGDTITALVEKPEREDYRLINAGVYAFDRSVFDALATTARENGTLPLTSAVEDLVEERRVRGVRTDGLWVDATYPWDLLTVAREVLRHGLVEEPTTGSGVWVANSATVDRTARLQTPVVIGPDCEVGAGAVVGPNVALGRNTTVGANATLEDCVLDTDTRVGPGSVLLDCVTGQDVHLGPGTVVPGGPADVQVGDAVHRGERLGAVLADRVRTGGAVTCEPGTLVGTSARLGTGVVVDGTVRADSEVVR
ncbi:bifunctional sugar-1-phosphate nucleotidylyltransferase/acetyltransferase [Halomarina litorea]|uniref:bifunctional sugar-1-phosphate nucleotidylyltransferase/acetyltransferase n=1 Tax=Halomarina litorea TaxID=2961595 RepID=UPI0020C4D39A|nr:bifunctional sugar-1-phosphate nucleotidylyltransferase/acetyltransferase [Halomarina sp. BCD28]